MNLCLEAKTDLHCLEHSDNSYLFIHVFLVSNLHFPQMKLAPEKPREAVSKFSWGVCTQTPLDYGVQSIPSLIL